MSAFKPKILKMNRTNRRWFLKKSTVVGMSGCALFMAARFNPLHAFDRIADETEIPDPFKLNYCGYSCPPDCKFLQATKENNLEMKKEAYEIWKVKERYGADFDPDNIFCWGCKNPDQPDGVILKGCQVRKCAIEKGFQACIECDHLTACDKELWILFPEFYKYVKEMQISYNTAKG